MEEEQPSTAVAAGVAFLERIMQSFVEGGHVYGFIAYMVIPGYEELHRKPLAEAERLIAAIKCSYLKRHPNPESPATAPGWHMLSAPTGFVFRFIKQ